MKFWLVFFCSLIFAAPSFALEEVLLKVDSHFDVIKEEDKLLNKTDSELTLYEKIKNIQSKEITDTNTSTYLLEDILTKNFESGIVKDVHLFGYYRGAVDLDIQNDDNNLGYDFNSISAGINGKFRDDKTYYEARFRFNPQNRVTFFQYLPSNLYIANTSIPHHTVFLGNIRTPTGVEGGMTMTYLPFITRSQIGRNFGNTRQVGLRIKGKYDLVDYDLGGYSSDVYFKSFFPGAEFAGWANLKPLGKTNGKYGSLILGGGLTAGQNKTNYVVSGLYAKYEYKKLFADFEYSSANGYNGAKGISQKHADGFYTTLGYKVTPKVQLVARYDQYTPDKKISNDIKREYLAGINYFIKGQALKLMLNYVFCQNDLTKDSHRLLLGTQILL